MSDFLLKIVADYGNSRLTFLGGSDQPDFHLLDQCHEPNCLIYYVYRKGLVKMLNCKLINIDYAHFSLRPFRTVLIDLY